MIISILSAPEKAHLGYCIKALLDNGIQIDSVILDSSGTSEKSLRIWTERTGGKLPPLPSHKFEKTQIPYFFVENHNSVVSQRIIRERGVDILLNAASPRILKPEIISTPNIGIINCHPGKLPDFRGCSAVEWAIYYNKQIANTIHFISEGIDEGPSIVSESYTFAKTDDYTDVRTKVLAAGFSLFATAIEIIKSNNLFPNSLPIASGCDYYNVIDEGKLDKVKNKLASGKYSFQF